MDSTMDRIQKLSEERYELYRRAGRRELDDDEYWRLQRISKQLTKLWDSYRRQQAAVNWSESREEAESLAQAA